MFDSYEAPEAPPFHGSMGPSLRRVFVLLSSVSLLALVLFLSYSDREIVPDSSKPLPVKWTLVEENRRGFVLNTPGCQIPDWDPYDPSVLPFVSRVRGPYKCPGRPLFMTSKPNAVITLDHNLLGLYYGVRGNLSCTCRPIVRDPGPETERTDSKYLLGDPRPLEFGVPLGDEFLAVNCSMGGEVPDFTQFIPLVPLKPKVEEAKSRRVDDATMGRRLNVIIVGIDSVSKLNFLRHFQKTHRFLRDTLHAYELRGYTKVADNTFPNLVPLLTGHFIERYWNESVRDMFFDDVPFVWKDFSDRGYRTLFAEDAPNIATFNYLKRGFREPPADYYFRPFALAVEKSLVRGGGNKANCIHSTPEIEVLYRYLLDFVATMGEGRPHFSFTFVARLTHDNLNAAGYADEPTHHLLRELHSGGALNRSLLVLFSDHGIRFGPIRQTYIGKFEERMPFMFLALPPWFAGRYPELARNLRDNQDRLTTPFDVHSTLVHLLRLNENLTRSPEELNETLTPHGLSLMGPVPADRTCDRAAILPHWCPCQTHKPVPVTDPDVINCAVALVDTLNRLLKPFEDACAVLRLREIMDARVGQANDVVLRFVKHQNDVINRHVVLGQKINAPVDYLIVIRVEPSGGVFEGTVRFDKEDGTYKVLDDISRLNMYGNQSACIEDARVRKFCYCKSQTLFHKIFRTMKNASYIHS